jgi:hypothetical protein
MKMKPDKPGSSLAAALISHQPDTLEHTLSSLSLEFTQESLPSPHPLCLSKVQLNDCLQPAYLLIPSLSC